ncbi:MAG: hypothetical protein V1907_01080 [Candidatus Kerfeldbacteria bacterium]
MKKALLIISFLTLMAVASVQTHVSAQTNTNGAGDEGNATVTVPQNSNENVNAPSGTTTPKRGNFRDPAALKPLLLVPLAGVLYLLYEKLAQRNK